MKITALFLLAYPYLSTAIPASPANILQHTPSVETRNGTVLGSYNSFYNQDYFLGIPFAEPPLGELRFDLPHPLTKPWNTSFFATSYGPACRGYSLHLEGFSQTEYQFPQSEDCLTLNIVRPSSPENLDQGGELLPVLVWLYGGGFQEGASRDQRYNMSYLVDTSVSMGTPIIAVSINYRVSGWGFLGGTDIDEAGLMNVALHDQRKAFDWIQENIAAFGGDPTRVTIHGESAGAISIGHQLRGYGKQGAQPFRAAIAESGAPIFRVPYVAPSLRETMYQDLLNATDCLHHPNRLLCLRSVPVETLDSVFNGQTWGPVFDEVIISQHSPMQDGNFARVPLLIGTNANEGTTFVRQANMRANNSDDVAALLAQSSFMASNETIQLLLQQYSTLNLSRELGPVQADAFGSYFGLASLAFSDVIFDAARRMTSEIWSEYGVPVYSYRFNTVPSGVSSETLGATHFQEIPFVFRNTVGNGYGANPFEVEPADRRDRYEALALLMARMWISFVVTLSPNFHGVSSFLEEWPRYSKCNPMNMVFDGNRTSYLERDDYRAGPIDLIRNRSAEFFY